MMYEMKNPFPGLWELSRTRGLSAGLAAVLFSSEWVAGNSVEVRTYNQREREKKKTKVKLKEKRKIF